MLILYYLDSCSSLLLFLCELTLQLLLKMHKQLHTDQRITFNISKVCKMLSNLFHYNITSVHPIIILCFCGLNHFYQSSSFIPMISVIHIHDPIFLTNSIFQSLSEALLPLLIPSQWIRCHSFVLHSHFHKLITNTCCLKGLLCRLPL